MSCAGNIVAPRWSGVGLTRKGSLFFHDLAMSFFESPPLSEGTRLRKEILDKAMWQQSHKGLSDELAGLELLFCGGCLNFQMKNLLSIGFPVMTFVKSAGYTREVFQTYRYPFYSTSDIAGVYMHTFPSNMLTRLMSCLSNWT